MKKYCALLIFVLILTACGSSTNETVEPEQSEQETAVLDSVVNDDPTSPVTENPTPTLAIVPTAIPEPEQPTAVSTDEPIVEEVVEEPVVEEVVPETAVISGRTEEGAFFYGNPNAPITLIDYSDFL